MDNIREQNDIFYVSNESVPNLLIDQISESVYSLSLKAQKNLNIERLSESRCNNIHIINNRVFCGGGKGGTRLYQNTWNNLPQHFKNWVITFTFNEISGKIPELIEIYDCMDVSVPESDFDKILCVNDISCFILVKYLPNDVWDMIPNNQPIHGINNFIIQITWSDKT